MPINPNLLLGGTQLQMPQPDPNAGMNALIKAMQIKDMQGNSRLNALKMDALTRDAADQTAMRNELSAPGADPQNVLMRFGKVKEAADYAQSQAATKASQLQAQRAELETVLKKAEHVASVMGTARDQGSYDLARQYLEKTFGPQSVANMPPQFDPATVQLAVANGQTLTQKLAAEHQRLTLAETGRHNQATEGLTARGQNISAATARRGQDLVDQRSRESTAATMTKPFEVTGDDGKPVLVQQDKQGNIRPVQGYLPKMGPASAGTEGERNAAGYASRMSAAEAIIGNLAATSPKAQKPGFIEQASGGVGMVANASRSEPRQQYRQAQEDWVRAKLRKESGAAIPNDEMEREITVYFPQINDKPAVIAQKAQARKVAEQAMIQAAGRAGKAAGAASAADDNDPLGLRK